MSPMGEKRRSMKDFGGSSERKGKLGRRSYR